MINNICNQIKQRLVTDNEKRFGDTVLLQISAQYAGLWLEHAYDAVIYAKMDNSKLYLARNTIEAFIDHQKDGLYPFRVIEADGKAVYEYSQIQECVSFLSLALDVSEMLGDREFDLKVYSSGAKWISWLENNRMTLGKGLVEMFYGYDTGHDNSGRLEGLLYKGNYVLPDGSIAEAGVFPEDEKVAPIFAVDMNCNFYGNLMSMSRFAEKLGKGEEAEMWKSKARDVKQRLFEVCFDKDDAFFYDADRYGNKRRYLSSTIFHLFLEGVLDREEDSELIKEICERHIKNEHEFWTNYPFPSMAICDKSCEGHDDYNCWGYFTQGLIVLRCTRWMDLYGLSDEFDHVCKKWVEAWTTCFDRLPLGQELDPISGEPTGAARWYSSCMLFYLYAVQRLTDKGIL